jgi:hypothetical protein
VLKESLRSDLVVALLFSSTPLLAHSSLKSYSYPCSSSFLFFCFFIFLFFFFFFFFLFFFFFFFFFFCWFLPVSAPLQPSNQTISPILPCTRVLCLQQWLASAAVCTGLA